MIKEKLLDIIWNLENSYDIRDIYCAIEDLKEVVNEMEE